MRCLRRVALVMTALLLAACSMVQPAPAALGTEQNPVKLALSPGTPPQQALTTGEPLARLLERETGLRIKLSVPTSYAAVIEAMGTHNVDVGWLGALAYVRAGERVGAVPLLAVVRAGSATRPGQVVVHADSGITTLAGLRGKRFAFVDEASVAGYHFPRVLLHTNGIDPGTFFAQTTFAGSHDQVVLAVYRRQVEGGATFGESVPGAATDARAAVQPMLPDVFEKVRVIAQTAPIPNDTVSVRQGIPPEIVQKLREGFIRVAASPAGGQALRDLDGLDGFAPVTDADFLPVREAVQVLGLDLDAEIAPHRASTSP